MILVIFRIIKQFYKLIGLDIYWRDSYTCPTEEEYIGMIQRKTGGLFGLGVRLMQLFSDDKRDLSYLISLLGTYFQIRDDYANLKSASVCLIIITELIADSCYL